MVRIDSIVLRNKSQLRIRITMVSPIFQAGDVWGRHQIRGNAKGPIEQTAKMIKDLRKYHGRLPLVLRGKAATSKNSPQCLHVSASL